MMENAFRISLGFFILSIIAMMVSCGGCSQSCSSSSRIEHSDGTVTRSHGHNSDEQKEQHLTMIKLFGLSFAMFVVTGAITAGLSAKLDESKKGQSKIPDGSIFDRSGE
jgi:hypothetical protein